MKPYYLLRAKIIPQHDNYLLRSIKPHMRVEHPITSSIPKMTLMVSTSFFIGKRDIIYCYFVVFEVRSHKMLLICYIFLLIKALLFL